MPNLSIIETNGLQCTCRYIYPWIALLNDDLFDRLETVRFFRLFTREGDMENTGRGNTEPRGLKARVLP